MGRDVAAVFVGILTIATVTVVVRKDQSDVIGGVGNLGQAVIRASFGKDPNGPAVRAAGRAASLAQGRSEQRQTSTRHLPTVY